MITSNDVSMVIPNWNGLKLLRLHLSTVIQAAKSAEIIIVDDGSTDGSMDFVKEKYRHRVTVIKKEKRDGFVHSVNLGVSQARGKIVILLNTDVVPHPDFLEPLLQQFSDPNVFAVGCLEKSKEAKGIVLRGRGLAQWRKGYFFHSRGEVDRTNTVWVSGGSGAFLKEAWQKLGGMETLYAPFYWEDIDLSYRALKRGYSLRFESKSIVEHYHEKGKILSEFSRKEIKTISYRNQYIFIWKNLSDPTIWIEHLLWTPIRLLQAIIYGDYSLVLGFLQAILLIPIITVHRLRQSSLLQLSDRKILEPFKE